MYPIGYLYINSIMINIIVVINLSLSHMFKMNSIIKLFFNSLLNNLIV